MDKIHIVADGDVPDDDRTVLAWWEGDELLEDYGYGVARRSDYGAWMFIGFDGWLDVPEPTYWWELPQLPQAGGM